VKIIRFESENAFHLGVVDGGDVVEIYRLDASLPGDLGTLLNHLDGDMRRLADLVAKAPASARRPLDKIRYALPVSANSKIICLGLNYLEHLKEGLLRDTSPKHPTVFMRIASSFVPHGQAIVRPTISKQFDYEAELVAIVGRRAKHMTIDNALSCIAAYTCGNEGTVRDYQRHTTQWGMGKNFDRSGSLGPWVVTADELPEGCRGLRIQGRLNGTVVQSDTTASMLFPLAETIVYLTRGIELNPGDLIVTGTPSGVGAARKPDPMWMQHGDEFEVEIEGIGALRNMVLDEPALARSA
jgi:2-keto-4-pentenoate hydratase/2-oxohepta-3-ene-1,7-dioic acid hydratase in catechol pathway